jgi:hypothetical protein
LHQNPSKIQKSPQYTYQNLENQKPEIAGKVLSSGVACVGPWPLGLAASSAQSGG